jgi:hypothetical protein
LARVRARLFLGYGTKSGLESLSSRVYRRGMKRTVIFVLVCALLFGILASWLGPKLIAYWYAPPVPSGMATAFNCTEAVTWAMNRLVWTQIIGSVVGAVVGAFVGAMFRGKAAPPPVAPTATTPPKVR